MFHGTSLQETKALENIKYVIEFDLDKYLSTTGVTHLKLCNRFLFLGVFIPPSPNLPISPSPHLPISQSPHLPISPSPHLPISPSPKDIITIQPDLILDDYEELDDYLSFINRTVRNILITEK